MKLFLKKLLLLTLVCAILAGVANFAFVQARGSLSPAYVQRFIHAPEQIQVANLGNSYGQNGFSYVDHPELSSLNLAYGYQTLAQDERVLSAYIDRFTKGSTLYIPVSYLSLIGGGYSGGDFLSLNRRFYYFLPRDQILSFSWREWLAVKVPGLFPPSWLATFWESEEFDMTGAQSAVDTDVKAHAEAMIQAVLDATQNDAVYAPIQANVDCLYRIIKLCKEHDVTPVLITTPFTRTYNELVPQTFLKKQVDFLNAIAAEEGITYLDYSRDVRLIDRLDLFINSDHLNDKGALVFTDLVLGNEPPVFE